MKNFNGEVLFLDRSDINTDEIIPERYLNELTKAALKPFLFEDLKLDGFDPASDQAGKKVVVTRKNFGCGSSREHAPWALEANGIDLVIAESFARIFRQNMFNNGMLAVELPPEALDRLFAEFAGSTVRLQTHWQQRRFEVGAGDRRIEIGFKLSGFDAALVEAGGWVAYADARY